MFLYNEYLTGPAKTTSVGTNYTLHYISGHFSALEKRINFVFCIIPIKFLWNFMVGLCDNKISNISIVLLIISQT